MSATEVKPHQPYLMQHTPTPGYGVKIDLGTWIECECGWISPSYSTAGQAHVAHRFHAWLVTTYPNGEGLEPKRLRANAWVLVDIETDEQVSPKRPATWSDKKTANRALTILRKGYGS